MMRVIRNLEIHAAHACNLTCESCSHYSNQGHKGMMALADAESWMAPWAARIDPLVFSILGGEPTINPDLEGIVSLARRHWTRAMIRIVTNGFFLRRHPNLPHLLREDGNALLYVSIHHNSNAYQEKLAPVADLLHDWVTRLGVRVIVYRSYLYWTQRYVGSGDTMEPFDDGDPRASWEICMAKYCTQLFEGKLWKCAPLAYLGLQAQKYDLSSAWTPYLGYTPLDPGCTNAELDGFFAREEERVCGMCPAQERPMRLPLPLPRSEALSGRDPQEPEKANSPILQLEALSSKDPIQGLLSRIDSPLFPAAAGHFSLDRRS
jgi:hypothetical protein